MKILILTCILVGLTACGTAVKVQSSGPIESAGAMIPVLVQYKLTARPGNQELFFWDEHKNRFNVKIASGENTEQGVIIYLPAGIRYAFSGLLTYTASGRREYSFGENLDLFKLKPGVVNALPYFEMSVDPEDKGFRFYQDKHPRLEEAKKKFADLSNVNEIHVQLLDTSNSKH
jgi:hypothetical protein